MHTQHIRAHMHEHTAPHTCAHAHSTHTWAHAALCLTPAGVRGGRLQCRASAPRCPWTLRDSNAQGRTPEALARGCLMASRLAALLKAGGEELFGPEGQTERDHSGSLGAALGPWGLQHHGLLPRSPWPQPQDEVALTARFTDSGPWRPVGSCLGGPPAVSGASGSSQRPCSPGRPSLTSADVKALVRELTPGPLRPAGRDPGKGRREGRSPGAGPGRRGCQTPRPPFRVTAGLTEPPPTSDSRPGPGSPLPPLWARWLLPHRGAASF